VPLWASARTCEFNAVWEWGMTKNEDVSWIPKPVRCSLKEYSTADLVAELSKRDGVESSDIECADGIAKTIVVHRWKE